MKEEIPQTNGLENEPNIEIEKKYLLDSEADAKKLEAKIKKLSPDVELVGAFYETGYYFPKLSKEEAKEIIDLVTQYSDEGPAVLAALDKVPDDDFVAIRLRKRKNREDKSFVLSFKASKNPLHDIKRVEFESEELSEKILDGFAAHGLNPESIWSSLKREYRVDENTKIYVQKVTGYGWTSEIESNTPEKVELMADKLGLNPLTGTVLDSMYEQYKDNWEDYYNGEGEGQYFSKKDWKSIEKNSKEKVARNKVA